MFKEKEKDKKPFFIYNIVPESWKLNKDESMMLSKILITIIIILIIIDLMAIMFYMKTIKRIDKLKNHSFTQVIKNNIEDSNKFHEKFAEQAKNVIENKNLHMIQSLDILKYNSNQLNLLSFYRVNLISLPKLHDIFEKLHQDPLDQKLILEASLIYNELEEEMKNLNNYVLPVNLYFKDNEQIDKEIKTFLGEIKNNLQNFLDQLHFMKRQRENEQVELNYEMETSMRNFNSTYTFIKKDGQFVKLNNYYETEFKVFDHNFIPLTTNYDGFFGAQITQTINIDLKLPRIYYCNLRAFIYSELHFAIKFQYIDEQYNKEVVIFETDTLSGGFKRPKSYNEFHVFELSQNKHSLYMRVISVGDSAETHFKDLSFECLSYRNFVQKN